MVKILRILLASPFILIGIIPAFVAAISFLIAFRVMTIGKPHEQAGMGVDIKSLMEMFGGNEDGNKQE